VVEELLGIHLAKEHSAADWSTRPLPQSWLLYAVLDVELLVDLRDAVAQLLADQDKLEFARQEFQATLEREAPVRQDPWRRLSGIHGLRSPRQLAVAKSLWEARDAYAQEIDTAPGRLVPDASITAAARAMPASKRDLAAMKDFSGRASRSQIDRWWSAIEAGQTGDDVPPLRAPGEHGPPPPRAWSDRNPEADARLKTARGAMTELSAGLSIPVENLLTPELLRRLAWSPPQPATPESIADALAAAGARTWQIEATAQSIARAFAEAHKAVEDEADEAS
jgi:ribonuclease D